MLIHFQNENISHLPSMVSVYAEEEESVSRAGEDFGEDAGEEVVLKIDFTGTAT